jgi:hypothetical protein
VIKKERLVSNRQKLLYKNSSWSSPGRTVDAVNDAPNKRTDKAGRSVQGLAILLGEADEGSGELDAVGERVDESVAVEVLHS